MSRFGRNCNLPIAFAVVACALPMATLAHAQGATWTDPATGKTVAVGSGKTGTLEEINFETDSSIVVDGFPTLGCVAQAMREDQELYIVISGYADGRGSLTHNRKLSQARAEAVMRYLRMSGVPADRMMAIGYGPLPKGGREQNFVNRRVEVTPHAGAFSGPVVEKIVVKEPCGGMGGHEAIGRIESNGTTFLISVDYDRIRENFRSEMSQMLKEQSRRDQEQRATEEATKEGIREDREERSQNGGTLPSRQKRLFTAVDFDSLEGSASNRSRRENAMDLSSVAGRVSIFGGSSSIKADKSYWASDAGLVWANGSASFQGVIGGETSALRRKLDGTAAFSWHFESGLNLSAVGAFGRMTGVPVKDSVSQTVTSSMLGGRFGWEGSFWSMGLTYLAPSGKRTQDPDLATMNKGAVAAFDLSMVGEHWSTVLQAFHFSQPKQSVEELSGATGGRVEVSYNFSKASLVVGAEALPVYAALSPKQENRVFLGLRFGSSSVRSGNGWMVIPSVRQRVAF